MEAIQVMNLIPSDAAMQLKYDYDQLDMPTGNTVRGAAIEIKAHAERAKVSMITVGQRLAEVKALLPHGQFEDWCQVEFDMSQRTAQRMMAAAEVFGDKSDTVSLLSDSAMYMLSGPSVPEAARVEVVDLAKETGESPTKAEVQAVIDKHKPDEALRDKCYKIEFWLSGKGWSGFGRKNEEGKFISGVRKGEHRFVWLDDDWGDRYEKVKAAEKIERAAIAAFIKLTPPKNDTVSPLPESPAPIPLTFAETKSTVYGVLADEAGSDDPAELLKAMASRFIAGHYMHKVNPGRSIDGTVFFEVYKQVRSELQARLSPPKPEPIPDRPLPSWVAAEPDRPAESETGDQRSETTPTAIVLELPPIPFPDKQLLIGQVKRAVGILNEEGFATAADLLRVAGRCAYDAKAADSMPVDVEPVVTEKVPTVHGEVSREFLIDITMKSFKIALNSLDDYGRLTGHFTDIPPAQRILEKIVKNLQDNLTR